jgi:hypothetical protein
MIGLMNWKGFGRKLQQTIEVLPQYLCGETEKDHENLRIIGVPVKIQI